MDYLGGMPTATPKPVKLSDKAEEMLRADLKNESDTIRAYRERVKQCEALGEYAIAEDIREILRQEQEHLDRPGHGAGRGCARLVQVTGRFRVHGVQVRVRWGSRQNPEPANARERANPHPSNLTNPSNLRTTHFGKTF